MAGSVIRKLKTTRVPFLLVIALAFMIIAAGTMINMRLDYGLDQLRATVAEANYIVSQEQKKAEQLASKLKLAATDDFIANEARTQYGYLAEGEIRFVVTNPEVLWDNYTAPPEMTPAPAQP